MRIIKKDNLNNQCLDHSQQILQKLKKMNFLQVKLENLLISEIQVKLTSVQFSKRMNIYKRNKYKLINHKKRKKIKVFYQVKLEILLLLIKTMEIKFRFLKKIKLQ